MAPEGQFIGTGKTSFGGRCRKRDAHILSAHRKQKEQEVGRGYIFFKPTL